MKAFTSYQFKTGFLAELDRNFPSYLSAWDRHDILRVTDKNATHFGYVHNGPAVLLEQEPDRETSCDPTTTTQIA